MNRAQRLLILYSRLVKNQHVNKEKIANEFGVHPRTIQRDIEDIREYLSDSNEHFYRQEIVYSHANNAYSISNNQSKMDSLPFQMLLLHLYYHSPIMHKPIYDTLKLIINESFTHDASILLSIMNKFNVIKPNINYKIIMTLHKAIEHHLKVNITTEEGIIEDITPIKLKCIHHSFYLTYEKDTLQFKMNFLNIQAVQIVDQCTTPTTLDTTLEMTKTLWHQLKDIFSVSLIETISDDKIIVTFKMTVDEMIEVLLLHSPQVRLIHSSHNEQFFNHLIRLNQVYFTQEISKD